MSYTFEKSTGDIVISGFEQGIASSPHNGIGNIQGANISTEIGEAICSYNRVQQSQSTGSGTFTQVNATTVSVSGITLLPGTWVTITSPGISGLTNGTKYYYVDTGKLSATFAQNNSTELSGLGAGSATFTVTSMTTPLMSATEIYKDTTNTTQYRYYVLDSMANVWVHDTATLSGVATPLWFLPEIFAALNGRGVSGLAVLNGWLSVMVGTNIFWKSTSTLGVAFATSTQFSSVLSMNFHNTLVGHQGKMYYTDGNFIGSIFPSTSLVTGAANIQSYCSYTAVTTTGTVTAIIGGSLPFVASGTRLPVTFFTAGNQPTNLGVSTLYYLQQTGILSSGYPQFEVYAAASGGSAIDMAAGATGTQYFNTFNPVASGGTATLTFTAQRLNLPFYEIAQCLAELGNTVVIGGQGNVLYPWDQVSTVPGDIIPLPENNTVTMVTANNMVYVFAGQKGNVYICNGSSASQVISVPDYCAGIPGTQNSYIEPYFSWGGAMFLRGRVWFSILDQTANKAGNCGGIWSFIPTNNMFIGQDTGTALRLENYSSYGTFNGVSPVLIPSFTQTAIGPQYWSAWYSSITSPTYGIDFTDTIPAAVMNIETDLIPVGTMLSNYTPQQIEYKLSIALGVGESLTISYRTNATDAYVSCGTPKLDGVAGYFTGNFQNAQWLQLKIVFISSGSSSSSFCRLRQIRIR